MSKALTDSTTIIPGTVLYHVYGIKKMKLEQRISKLTIVTKPDNKGFFDCICTYVDFLGNMQSHISNKSLKDCGIMPDGYNRYNLNRLFSTESDAAEFCFEIVTSQFSDPNDAILYLRDNHRVRMF